MLTLGKQIEGHSPSSIKEMALEVLNSVINTYKINVTADIGGGKGIWALQLSNFCDKVILIDSFNPHLKNDKIEWREVDLNSNWPITNASIDFAFALEVIEHIENPRFFIREMKRVIKVGGYGFISTPNNLNIFSRINLLFKGQHRFFQDSCYPAHISANLKIDFERMLNENRLELIRFYFNKEDVIPLLGLQVRLPFALFSNTIGILFKKNE